MTQTKPNHRAARAGMGHRAPDVHRTIVVVDVEGFGDRRRTNRHQIAVRDALYRVVRRAFEAADISWAGCDHEDRGDGVFILAPAAMPKAHFLDLVPPALVRLLSEHNATHLAEERIRLRLALHAGEVAYDDHGVTAASINLAFRLLDAEPLKTALTDSPGVLAVITSEWYFDEVVRHSQHTDPATFRPVQVAVKETSTIAWISLPDHPFAPDTRHLTAPPSGQSAPSVPPAAPTPSQPLTSHAHELANDSAIRSRQPVVITGAANHEGQVRDIHLRQPRRPEMPTPQLLPPDVTHFTGRQAELEQLDALLNTGAPAPAAMVISAIAGTAGMGKTSLAVRWAHRVRDRFPDGRLYVNLRGFDPGPPVTPEQALDGLLRAVGVPGESIPRDLDAMAGFYRSLLAGRRMLVVLDNAASPEQVRPLLPASPTCLVLVTSRSRLSGLVARDGAHRITLGLLSPDEAASLLRAIIGTARADAEPEAIAELTHQCAYLPLAVRIAAERATAHPHRQIANLVTDLSRERDRLTVLATGDDDTTAVRTVLSWSYHALTPEAARVFRLLGLHPGPDISLPAVAALTGTTPAAARQLLDALAAMHLIEETSPDRYTSHDLLRAYAAERAALDCSQTEHADAAGRVLEWYLHTAQAAFQVLNPGQFNRPIDVPEPGCQFLEFVSHDQALRWCDTERDNLMAAVNYAADIGRHDIAWKLPVIMTVYYHVHSCWADQFAAHRIGLTAARLIQDRRAEYWILVDLCDAYLELDRFDAALDHAERALAITLETDYRWGEGYARQCCGHALFGLGRFDEAADHLNQALIIHRETDDRRGQGVVLVMIGEALRQARRFVEALEHIRQGLDIIRAIHRHWEEGYALRSLARVYRDLHRPDDAINHYQQSVTYLLKFDHRYRAARTLQELADTQYDAGQPHNARESWHAALAIFDELNSPQAVELRARLDTLDTTTSPPAP